MAIHTFYRGVQFIKDYLIRYLNGVFMASEKGQLLFTDGTKNIQFEHTPIAQKRGSWDFRRLPAVLIGQAGGEYQVQSIAKDLVYEGRYDDSTTELKNHRYYGGDIKLTINLQCLSKTIEERDNLVDIVCLYLAHPDAKDFFLTQGIHVEAPPSISGEADIYEPKVDHPIYGTTVTTKLTSQWKIQEDLEDRLIDIITDVTAVLDL
jgi:hypothetical protein